MRIYPFFYNHVISHIPENIIEVAGGPFSYIASLFTRTVDLPCRIGNLQFKNPIGMSSGWADSPWKMDIAYKLGAGIVISKTITVTSRKGNLRRRIIRLGDNMINSMGLPNHGVDYWVDRLQRKDYPVILSIRGENEAEWEVLIEKLEGSVDIFEFNFSCPNLKEGVMDLQSSEQIINDVAGITSKKVWLKISPEFKAEQNLSLIQKVRDEIDGITCLNTVPVVDRRLGQPQGHGGLSGPTIQPYLLKHLTILRANYPYFSDLPIFAAGGIDESTAGEILLKYKAIPLSLTSFLTKGPFVYQRTAKNISKLLRDKQISIESILS